MPETLKSCPFCGSKPKPEFNDIRNRVRCSASSSHGDWMTIVEWNTRPQTELERLARAVAKQYRLDSVSEMTAELSDPIDELALYFERTAEQDKKSLPVAEAKR